VVISYTISLDVALAAGGFTTATVELHRIDPARGSCLSSGAAGVVAGQVMVWREVVTLGTRLAGRSPWPAFVFNSLMLP
jgi:hypothetical protein